MSEAVKIAVIIRGGVVAAVLTAGVPVSAVVVDYDSEGVEIKQDDGWTDSASVESITAQTDGAHVLELFALAEGGEG